MSLDEGFGAVLLPLEAKRAVGGRHGVDLLYFGFLVHYRDRLHGTRFSTGKKME